MHRSEISPEIDVVKATATTLLSDAVRDRIRQLASGDVDWTSVHATAGHHGTIPLLFHNLVQYAADLVPAQILRNLRASYRQEAMRNLVLTAELNRIVDLCRRNNIRLLSFKGPTLAALAYGNLSLRSFVDLDLLVAASDFERVYTLLCSAGFRPRDDLTEVERTFHISTRKQFALRGRHGALIELHTQLSDAEYRLPMEFENIWFRRQGVKVAEQEQWTLGTEDLCLLLSVHGSKHQWGSLKWICDFSQFLRSDDKVDWSKVIERSRAVQCEFMVLLAATMARRVLGSDLPVPLADACASNSYLEPIAVDLEGRLFHAAAKPWSLLQDARYHWSCQGSLGSTIWRFFRMSFMPHDTDWLSMRLPKPLWFLYLVVRPARLVMKRVGIGGRKKNG